MKKDEVPPRKWGDRLSNTMSLRPMKRVSNLMSTEGVQSPLFVKPQFLRGCSPVKEPREVPEFNEYLNSHSPKVPQKKMKEKRAKTTKLKFIRKNIDLKNTSSQILANLEEMKRLMHTDE